MLAALQECDACVMPEATRNKVDERHGALGGTKDWIRAAAMPFRRTGSCKAVDWKRLLQFGLDYCFADCIPQPCKRAFWTAVKVFQDLLGATCDVDGEGQPEERLRELQRECVLALSLLDRDLPETEKAIIIHAILHLPECVYRWNNVRNTWAFHCER